MYTVVKVVGKRAWIKDSKDGVVEPLSFEQIHKLTKQGVKIQGVSKEGIHVYAKPTDYVVPYKPEEVIDALLSKLKRTSSCDVGKKTDTTLDVRYWGDWEITEEDRQDCYNDYGYDPEEVGDYDYETLCKSSEKQLREIIADLEKRFVQYKIEVQVSEKNWIMFRVRRK